MKTVGIIAEYNPFHNGHQYQIKEAKKQSGADFAVIAMSGDFVQRGTPAILDKYTRTKMALLGGADLVLELPSLWSCASAEYFAAAGIALLEQTGIVDTVSFGCESVSLEHFFALSDFLCREPEAYRNALNKALKDGNSFPKARVMALAETMPDITDDVLSLLLTPNNILALEYCKALQRRISSMSALPVLRIGAGYHEECTDSSFSSATGIRRILNTNASDFASLSDKIPAAVFHDFKDNFHNHALLSEDDFSAYLGLELLKHDDFCEFADVSGDLSNRILRLKNSYVSYSSFAEQLKSKDMTHTRLNRVLCHILLGHKEKDYDFYRNLDYVPYIRVLGCKQNASVLLKEMKHRSPLPLVTNLTQASSVLTSDALHLLEKDLYAHELYRLALTQKSGRVYPTEYQQKFLKI